MKTAMAYEIKVGDNVANIGKISKINTSLYDHKTYYHLYGEYKINPITFEAREDVYVLTEEEV